MKRHLLITVVFLGILAIAAQAQATIIITPATTPQYSGNQTSQAQIDAAIAAIIGSSVLLYKQDVGGPESGALAGSYATSFDPPVDPAGATITYGTGNIVGPTAWLLVKDGNMEPSWYLFNLTSLFGWDGKETLEMSGFWPTNGAISHVSLYGTAVPEPGTLLLLGSGLVGLAIVRRKFKA